MDQVLPVFYRWIYVFAFLCLVSNQRVGATPTYAPSTEETPPYRVARGERTQTVTTIWHEDFNGQTGATADSGPTAWTTDNTALGNDGDNYFQVRPDPVLLTDLLVAKNTDGEVMWESEPINISGYADVKLSAYIRGDGPPAMDGHLQLYYRVDNGPLIPWLNGLQRGRFDPTYVMADGINGSALELIIRARNTTDDDYYKIDNIRVYTEPNERYAITSGDWNDGSTWSYTSGGASCACVPDLLSDTHIIGGRTVETSAHVNTRNLTVHPNSQLRWASSNQDLTLWGDAMLDIKTQGRIDYNGNNSIKFNQWNDEVFDSRPNRVDDSCPGGSCPEVGVVINIDDPAGFRAYELAFNAKGTYTIQGSGNMQLLEDLDINHQARITNKLLGEISVAKHFSLHYPNAEFINDGSVVITRDLWYRRDDTHLINDGTFRVKGWLIVNAPTGGQLTNRGTLTIEKNTNANNHPFLLDISFVKSGGSGRCLRAIGIKYSHIVYKGRCWGNCLIG